MREGWNDEWNIRKRKGKKRDAGLTLAKEDNWSMRRWWRERCWNDCGGVWLKDGE